jgi:hypothetical protein
LNPYTVGDYQLEVANDVFNSVGHVLSCPLVTAPSVSSVALCCQVALYCSGVRRVVSSDDTAL